MTYKGKEGTADTLPAGLAPGICTARMGQLSDTVSEQEAADGPALMRPQVVLRLMFSDFEPHSSRLAFLFFLLLTEI
jgi:hypothetical protein